MYNGKVTDKKTGKPIAGIAVSDGRNIAFTDESGAYSLGGWEKSNTVSVYTLTKSHDDWFYYTGGKGGTYNFEITPADEKEKLSFLHTSDTEIHERDVVDWIPFAKECVDNESASFFVHTGDICRAPGLERHYKVMNFDTVGCPVRYVIGNHDFCDGDYGEQLYEKLYGPVWCSFDYSGVHFIVLSIGSGEKPTGYTLEDQWIWLKNDLETVSKDTPIIIFDHDSAPDEHEFIIKTNDGDLDLKKYNLLAWIFGHYHTNYHHVRGKTSNICTTCPDCGGVDNSAVGIRIIKVCDNAVTSRMIYCGLYESNADKSVWQKKLPGSFEFAEPVLYEGDVLASSMTEGYPTDCGIFRLDGKTGDIKWSFKTKYGIKNSFAVSDGKIYAQDSAGYFYCIDAENGKLIFEKFIKLLRYDFTRLSVLCVKDKVFTGRNKTFYAFDKNTGEQIWCLDLPKGSNSASKPIYDEKNNRIILGNQWRFMASVDIETGEIVWQTNDPLVWHRNSTPVIHGDRLYTCGAFEIGCIYLKTGEIIQKEAVETELNTVGVPLIEDGLIYFPTSKAGVQAFDLKTLRLRHTYPAGHSKLFTVPYIYNVGEIQMVESAPVIKDDTLVFSAMDGCVYFYDKKSEKLLRKITLEGPSLTAPTFDGDSFIVTDFFGNVYKF